MTQANGARPTLEEQIAQAIAPLKVQYATYPRTGVLAALPSGLTEIDFVTRQVRSQAGATALNPSINWQETQSFVLVVDIPLAVELLPSMQMFAMSPGVLEGSSRMVEQMRLYADA